MRLEIWRPTIALVLAVFLCRLNVSGQQNPVTIPAASPVASLGDIVQRSGHTQLHIFYVHGIGANGPDHDSRALRESICHFLGCATKIGELDGTEYADQHAFALNAPTPALTYLGEPVWKSNPPGAPSTEWNASAPYVDHWKLEGSSRQIVYVDEINWWPLVFSLKCREMVAKDAPLVGPSATYLKLCSESQPDPNQPGRFRLYPWISAREAQELEALPAHAALINRKIKNNLLDWGFSDALLAVGNLQPLLLEGIRQLILKSVDNSKATGQRLPQEFAVVTHSLGSYLIFAALDVSSAASNSPEVHQWQTKFNYVLSRTPIVYFFANQLRLLELANLGAKENMIDHLNTWAQLRLDYLFSQTHSTAGTTAPAKIVAWSDPSDLLTWRVPEFDSSSGQKLIHVENRKIKNSFDWFGVIEGPTRAHDNYASQKKIVRDMLRPARYRQPQ